MSAFSLKKSNDDIKTEIIVNVMRMMIQRKNINIANYLVDGYTLEDVDDIYVSISELIDDAKIMQAISPKLRSDVFKFDLDKEIDGKTKFTINFIPYKITDIKSSEIINDKLKKYNNYHKIFVIDQIQKKPKKELVAMSHVEVFTRDDMMIDHMRHIESPYRCTLIPGDEVDQLYYDVNKRSKCFRNDKLAEYFNAKVGDCLLIINYSRNNVLERVVLRVIEPKLSK